MRSSHQERDRTEPNYEKCHLAYGIDFDVTDIDTFISWRPDGLAFDKEKKLYVFLNVREQWTLMRTGQRRRSRRKTTDTAHN